MQEHLKSTYKKKLATAKFMDIQIFPWLKQVNTNMLSIKFNRRMLIWHKLGNTNQFDPTSSMQFISWGDKFSLTNGGFSIPFQILAGNLVEQASIWIFGKKIRKFNWAHKLANLGI